MNVNGNSMQFSEQETLFRERTGNDFTFFYKKYYPKLIYYTNKMCNDPQEAEDISTDSFMIALQKIDKYEKEKAQFSTWLFTIARNLMLQNLKTRKRFVSMDYEIDDEGTTMKDFIPQPIEDGVPSEEQVHELFEKKAEIIKRHIDNLEPIYRKVIEMRELKKMPYKNIATELKLNENTVKSQIRNGRIKLQKMVKKDFDLLDEMYM
jgi:RNA polymerase sigma-70 factor (ECF subfamily)